MGTLRTIYALAVVLFHCHAGLSVGGRNAVQLFYIISGFLMSFVLVEKRTYKRTSSFYINRYLRLYPIYAAVALLALFENLVASTPFLSVYHQSPRAAGILLVFSNLFLFGQDWVMFSAVRDNALRFTTNFHHSQVLLWQGLLVPQAWTLGVELSFYLIAPFILLRRGLIVTLLALSLGLRVYLIVIGIGARDPWTYRFFPCELSLFLAGALAHQYLLPLYRALPPRILSTVSVIGTVFLALLAVTYTWIPLSSGWKSMLLFVTFIPMVPCTFIFQNQHRFDSLIGDLSYPIYIGHVFVIGTLRLVAGALSLSEDRALFKVAAAALSILFAVALNRLVAERFESLRERFRKSAAPSPREQKVLLEGQAAPAETGA